MKMFAGSLKLYCIDLFFLYIAAIKTIVGSWDYKILVRFIVVGKR